MTRALAPLLALLLAAPAAAQGVPPLGEAPLSSAMAAKFFDAVCLSTAPSFDRADETLAANGFAPNPETGTFYHPTLNLSFQLRDRCSMVFASEAAAEEVGFAFAAATAAAAGSGEIAIDPATGRARAPGPAGTAMTVAPFVAPSGEPYFRALLEPAQDSR